ncbi:hypothetical protein H1R20_g2669, partial [Candolleomyces eurysporus]
MSRILELIHGWKEGICAESRWKEDLGNIRDMHRLLTFKGYRFREFNRSQPGAAATANLKTAEELEEEDRAAQSAKLQELIRRGTPRDLAAAQELMKSLAGANPDAKPDYRAQALTELNKLEQKVILLNEMLDNVDTTRGEKFVTGDAYDQVSSILKAARPKIQKWISDAQTDDPESLDTFLQINDQINNVMTRYEAYQKGDYSVTAVPKELSSSSNAQPQSLIDFDDSEPTQSTSQTTAPGNDLAGLFASPSPPQATKATSAPSLISPFTAAFGATTGAPAFSSFGGSPPAQQPLQPIAPQPLVGSSNGGFAGYNPTHSLFGQTSTPPIQSTATPPAAIRLGGTPTLNPTSSAPNYFSSNTAPQGPVGIAPGAIGFQFGAGGVQSSQPPSLFQQQPQQSFGQPIHPGAAAPQQPFGQPIQPGAAASQQPQQKKDPFDDLAGLF